MCYTETYDDRTSFLMRDGLDETSPIHLHCQATVCQVYGPSGEDWTWDYFSSLSLSNLPENWLDLFACSWYNCITDDFCAILKLIDQISSELVDKIFGSSEKIKFIDLDNRLVTSTSDVRGVFKVNLGYVVTLRINNKPLSFHTLVKKNLRTSIDLTQDDVPSEYPNNTITLYVNDSPLSFKLFGEEHDGDYDSTELELQSFGDCDRNEIPMELCADNTIVVSNPNHIYDIVSDADVIPNIQLCQQYIDFVNDETHAIVFEIRIYNSGNSEIRIGNPIGWEHFVDAPNTPTTIKPNYTHVYGYKVLKYSDTEFILIRRLIDVYGNS